MYREYRIMYHVDDAEKEVLILTVLHSSRQFGGFG
jgi:mRNA-degrading endonuclease RelE of RelBE toxin-antitoxin system